MRLTGGAAKGRKLRKVPAGAVRPTGARVRAAVFNLVGQDLSGLRVLDLFAGVGTLGLEALSRGAAHVVFVERSPRTLRTLRENLAAAGFSDRATVVGKSLGHRLGLDAISQPFDLVVADPPYKDAANVSYVVALLEANLATPRARFVIEHGVRVAPPDTIGPIALIFRRRYGDTVLSIYGKSERMPPGDGT